MALSASQALSGDAPTDVDTTLSTYVQRFADESKSVFSVAGLTPPNEKKLTISHEVGNGGEDRHLARIDYTVVDAFGVAATISCYMVIVRPPNTALTTAVCIGVVYNLVDFLIEGGASANIISLLNNEV